MSMRVEPCPAEPALLPAAPAVTVGASVTAAGELQAKN